MHALMIDLPRALLRGHYMAAVAHMEHNGIPIDVEALDILLEEWPTVKLKLIKEIDAQYNVFEGVTFKIKKFSDLLDQRGIPWPRTPKTNAPILEKDVFKDQCAIYPEFEPLRTLKKSLDQLKSAKLEIGADHRHLTMLSAFGAKTGRNTPKGYVFGLPSWLRRIIKPTRGMGLAELDYEQQEIGIAAALSHDVNLQSAYRSGDTYLDFAKKADAIPPDVSKEGLVKIRERFKQCALGINYGMGYRTLALRVGQSELVARELIRQHRRLFPDFWKWSEGRVSEAMVTSEIHTVFGWRHQVTPDPRFPRMLQVNDRSLANFAMQSNGAEMLRVAICLALERGVKVIAPVHDAILIEAGLADLDRHVSIAKEAMVEASREVLDGFELRVEVKVTRYPNRYQAKKGAEMWKRVWSEIAKIRELKEDYAA